ncbi:DUF2239 family protein [Phenylobacterium sp.]|uniref:DUF2239 family protein n=1 Tax=Phenylobacterium sp. TaxID=1871053 RepID=UPI002CC4DEC4|nr:DUF2239 family protein [Phenylobacterium sp.]HVI33795.1 DUF2239 family protein [Phenylobacterium sp.]
MSSPIYTAFADGRQLAAGTGADVARVAREAQARGAANILVFEDASGRQVELDPFSPEPAFAGAPAPEAEPVRSGRGRPRLGVVAREVTLLPRHWDWLSSQPGGASAALRRLVEDARRAGEGADRARRAQEALYKVMATLAGDLPGFEEAARALYARDDPRFDDLISAWPRDVGAYLARLAATERAARLP